jgi:hypothetical protein
MKQSEEYFLGEEGIIDFKEIQYGKLNIINAPCGSGKTTFVEDRLWTQAYWGELLYLIDTRNALEAFKVRGEEKEYNGEIYYKHKGITAMTYGTFAMLCIHKPEEWLWDDEDALIVCDELQSAIKWSKIKQENNHVNLHEVALAELHKRIRTGARIVAITATPFTIKKAFEREYVNMPIHGKLKRYRAERKQNFRCLKEIIPQLPADKRGIIYTPQIRQFFDIQQELAKRGIKADGFWSVNNMDHNMTEEQLEIRKSVILHGIIPDNIQVLLINAASETGINITSPVDYVVVNDSNPDTQIQAVGRVRHDLETIYLRDLEPSKFTYIPHYYIDEKWLNRRLYAEDKEALCRELVIVDERGRRYKWPNIRKTLIYSDFKVTDKRDKDGRRYSVIER